MVTSIKVEGGTYFYKNGNSADYVVRDINDAESVNGLRFVAGPAAGSDDNTIYFVTE